MSLKIETMPQAVRSESMPLGLLGRFDAKIPQVILTALITDLVKFLNIGKNMTGVQVGQTAELILNDYECRNLKPEDYKVIFQDIKKGAYGRSYDRMDGQVIFEAIRAYIQRRDAWIEENNYREHNHHKQNEKSNLIPPEVVEMYKQILANVKRAEEEVETKKPAEKVVREKSHREKLIQQLFMEFYREWEKEKMTIEGKRFLKIEVSIDTGSSIRVEEKIVDEVEYVEYKLNQICE